MFTAVIVDDEEKAIESLKWELIQIGNEIEVIASFTDPNKAIDFLAVNTPHCIFLDIEMPGMDGFQFIQRLNQREQIAIIISTAYNQYGIEALKNEALDYILKPIDSNDLRETVNKIYRFHSRIFTADKLEKIIENSNKSTKKIVLKVDGKLIFLERENILFAESDGNYSTIYLADGQKILLTKKLKEVGDLFPEKGFFRIHNSYIINLEQVREFLQSDGYVILKSNHKIPVSRQKKSEFLDLI